MKINQMESNITKKTHSGLIGKVHYEACDETCDEPLYAIFVYELIPEFMLQRAFRRSKHYKSANTKAIKCPYCSNVLTTVDTKAKLELFRYPKHDRPKVNLHQTMPCKSCRNIVGIIYKIA